MGFAVRNGGRWLALGAVRLPLLISIALLGSAALIVDAAPQPTVVFRQVPSTVLIGETFAFVVEFTNPSPDLGYRPFIDLALPAGGTDKNANDPNTNAPGVCDGIRFVSVKLADPQTASAVAAPDCSCVSLSSASSYWTFNPPHPALNYIQVDNSNPTAQPGPLAHPYSQVNQQIAINPGDELVTIELPFANYSTHTSVNQPPLAVEVTAHVHAYADVGVALPIRVRAGFRNGSTYNGSTPVLSDATPNSTAWTAQALVTPVPFAVTKTCPDTETATGESFSHAYTIAVDVAAGQTIQDMRVLDQLPPELFYYTTGFPAVLVYETLTDITSATPNPCLGPTGLLFPVSVDQPSGSPGGYLEVFACEPVTGVPGMSDEVVVPFDAYVADNAHDAQCQPYPKVVANNVSVMGNYVPLDPRDTSPTFFTGFAAPKQSIDAKCLAIQKSVEVFSDTNEPGLTPGDTLEYTLRFQLSDYRTVHTLVIEDTLSDGQHLVATPPTLAICDWFDTYAGPFPAVAWSSAADPQLQCPPGCSPGIVGGRLLTFDLSAAMAAVSVAPRWQAGIWTGGLAASVTPLTPAVGEIVYYAQVDDTFKYPQTPGDPYVDKGDPMLNCATIRGELCTNEPAYAMPAAAAVRVGDDGCSVIPIVAGTLTKEVYAVKRNGNLLCCSCSTPDVWPGDDVTFRFRYTIPSGDAEHLTFRDWLPYPIFDVGDPDGGPCGLPSLWSFAVPQPELGLCATCSLIPAPGEGLCGPDHSTLSYTSCTLFSDLVPTAPLPGNSLGFDYSWPGGPYDCANEPKTVDYVYTLRVTNEPFPDNVVLSNEVLECEENTLGARLCQGALAPVHVREPQLSIRKGVVATTNPWGQFLPYAPTVGGSWNGPFWWHSGVLTSSNVGGFTGRDLVNVDAGDTVVFAIVVENTGGAPAYEITIEDAFPTNPTTCQACYTADTATVYVRRGDGTLLYPYTVFLIGPNSFKVVISGPLDGVDPSTNTNQNGTNLAVITFSATLPPASAAQTGCCEDTATLVRYTSARDILSPTYCAQPDFVSAGLGGPFSDSALVCIGPWPYVKCIESTSETHTTNTSAAAVDAAIGEVVRFRLVTVIPEGTALGFQMTDLLPPGLTYIGNPYTVFVADSAVIGVPGHGTIPGDQTTHGGCPGGWIPPDPPFVAVQPFGFGAGQDPVFFVGSSMSALPTFDPTNSDADPELELAIIEFNAQVDNIASNQSGVTLSNSFHVSYQDPQGQLHGSSLQTPVSVRIVEPRLKITTSATPGTVAQGGTVTYAVTIEHDVPSSTADAFDIRLTDVLPAGFTYVMGSMTCSAPPSSWLDTTPSSGTVSAWIEQLALTNLTVTVTYQAIANTTTFCTPLADAAAVTWTSLPGSYGTPPGSQNPTGQQTVGPSGAINGERNGAGTNPPNNYVAASAATVTVQGPCIPVPSGIVAWWPLDETTGLVVEDIVGAFNGTPMCTAGVAGPINSFPWPPASCDCYLNPCGPESSAYWNTFPGIPNFPIGQVGNSLFFWSARHIQVPHAVALDPGTGGFTVDAWVIFAPAQNWTYLGIAQKGGLQGTSGGWRFAVHDTSAGPKLTFDLLTPAGGGGVVAPISLGWHHVAATMQRQPSNVVLTLFIDGSAVSTATVLGVGANVNIGSSNDLFIGRCDGAATGEFALDEVEIFNRVLTAQEIYDIMCSGKCKPDLGDALDSTSSAGSVIMYAYTGVVANFPTVFNSSGPRGPIHRNATSLAWLGASVSLEGEADTGWDQDLGMLGHNISPTLGTADSDGCDDGVGPITLTSWTSMSFPFTATSVGTSSVYVNVWFDWNQDGDWNDVVACPFNPTDHAPEWAVANYLVSLNPGLNDLGNNPAMITPSFTSVAPSPGQAIWMRISLTDVPVAAVNSDGSGPPSGYAYGETEDYLVQPCCTPAPTGDFVAWWTLDETSGPTAHDRAGVANDGVWNSSPAPVAGTVQGGLQFDGVDDYVQVSDHAELDVGTGDFSIDAWVYLQVGGTVHTLVDKRSQVGGWHGYLLFVDTYNHLCLQLADGSATNYWSDVVVTPGQWHHVAVTVDRSSSTGIQWYLDGSQIQSPDDPTLHPESLDNTGPLLLGKNAGTAYWLHGILDEVEIFRRVLTPSEIKAIFAAGSCGKCK